MILLVGLYWDESPARTEEFLECLRRNAADHLIDRIHVFLEERVPPDISGGHPVLAHPKARLIAHGKRLTYAELFQHANRELVGEAVIVANADIFFDETLALLDHVSLVGCMLCLSRWDEDADGVPHHLDHDDSQDAWIFQPPLPPIASDFFLGTPGCDNRLAHEAERAGMHLSNPSLSVRSRHLHLTGVRRYAEGHRLGGTYRLVPASLLDGAGAATATTFPSHRGRRVERAIAELCREIELAHAAHLDDAVPRAIRRELRGALATPVEEPVAERCRHLEAALSVHLGGSTPGMIRDDLRRLLAARLQEVARPKDPPLASVAFREPMGYTLVRLELGASSHNNDLRPLCSVPEPLRGRRFTQVVACHATPVDIEFRSAGRLYVLAARGWDGFASAAAFLDAAGWREPLEPVRTEDGTTFEVWSLVAEAGEHLSVPTQVMLVSDELVRLD